MHVPLPGRIQLEFIGFKYGTEYASITVAGERVAILDISTSGITIVFYDIELVEDGRIY